jgi:tetratricopeptide (TPR) repeat protein
MQEDGTPPPPGAVIEMDCGGSLKRKAEVSLDGRFGFQLEDTRGLSQMLPDASEGTQYTFDREFVGEAPETRFPVRPQTALVFSGWTGCDLRARLNGYRSSILRLDGGSMAGFNEMGTIVIYPIGRVRGSAVSATSLLAPKTAKKSVEQAKKALQKKEFDKAESHLKSAVTLYPQYGEAWLRLGQLYQNQGRNEEAREAYRKAREADALQSF